MARFVCRNPKLQPLIDAYVAETGIAVSWTAKREAALQKIHDLELDVRHVKAVLQWIRRKLAAGANGFTETSLLFSNAIEKWEGFEERVQLIRQERARQPKARPMVAHVRELPDGKTVTVLGEATPVDADLIAAKVREQAEEFRRKMRGEG